MTTRRKIFLLLSGLPALILILSALFYFSAAKLINSESVKERIHVYLLGKAGASITYGNSEFHLFPLPELIFHQVNISIPGKAEGSVASLRAYPDLFSLMKGRVWIAKVSLETPHFTVKMSKDTEKPSLEQMEEKIRSAVHYLVSTTPGLRIAVRGGKLDFMMEDKIAFSFDLIQSRLSASKKALDIELNSRSNLWDNFSISSSIEADDLKGEGTIRLTHLRPDILIALLSKETAGQIGVSDVDLSAKFETSGLRVLNASVESSVSELAVSRGKKRVTMGDTIIKGDIEIEPDAVSLHIKQAKISRPALNLSGLYTLNRNSGIITVNIEGKSIAVESVRKSALDLGGDIPLIRSIFTIVQGGEIPALHVHTTGKSLAELGRTENIRIAGKMRAGIIYIESTNLTFQNVAGDVLISRGVLESNNVGASLGNHRCSGGKLRIGLKGKDAPFHVNMRVKADMEQLPSLLTHKNLLKNEAVLHEMDRLHNLRGSAEGRLILGDRIDSIHVKIAVDNLNITARYEPLPFPLAVTGGKFFFDEKTVGLADSGGSIGGSSFSGLTARLSLTDPYDLEITGGRLSISADEIFPWLASFEEIRPVLKDVRSVKGVVSVSSVDLRGPLCQPKEWKFHVNGKARKLTLDAAFLPGKAEEMSGMFAITQNELSLKNMRSKIIDSMITVTGSVREFPSDIRSIDFALRGEIGPKVTAWITELINLPPEMKIRAPFSVTDALLSLEKDRKTAFSGGLLFGQGTRVSLTVTKTPDSTTIRDFTVKDRSHDLAGSIVLTRETIDASLKGTLTSQTLNTIFADSIYSDASLEGAFRTHIVIKHPRQSTAEGRLKGENIPVPWNRDIPLVVRHIELEAKEQGVVIDTAELAAGDMTFKVKGTLSSLPAWFSVDMDISANGIEWETFENILRNRERAVHREKTAGFLKDFPVRGTLKLRSDFFRYRQFRWEPFHADVSFDGKTLLIAAKKAALCSVSTTGSVGITEQGIKIDVALSAKDLAFEPTVLCLTDKQADFTGTFQMEARMKGEGKIGEIASRLDGAFTLSAKDGKILKAKSLDKTFDLLNESENFKGQFPDLDREIISYSALKIRGAVRERRIQIEEGMLDAPVMGIIARGHLDLSNETLDLNAFVSPLKTVHRVVRRIPILGYVMRRSLVSIPVKISGNMKDPQITFLSLSAIGSGTLGMVERIFKLPITLVEPVFPTKNEKQ
ncbi:MAG: AsmA-like C-terminal domain-containing protein [Nitrospirae bacterium]|nr:AsmA-like C-terminal domain-containing protein [Nitrospirota bacterium]